MTNFGTSEASSLNAAAPKSKNDQYTAQIFRVFLYANWLPGATSSAYMITRQGCSGEGGRRAAVSFMMLVRAALVFTQ